MSNKYLQGKLDELPEHRRTEVEKMASKIIKASRKSRKILASIPRTRHVIEKISKEKYLAAFDGIKFCNSDGSICKKHKNNSIYDLSKTDRAKKVRKAKSKLRKQGMKFVPPKEML